MAGRREACENVALALNVGTGVAKLARGRTTEAREAGAAIGLATTECFPIKEAIKKNKEIGDRVVPAHPYHLGKNSFYKPGLLGPNLSISH